MRIVGGELGGRRLAPVPKRGVRPTADPVREALFNRLGASIDERPFADLAAGTGAVGLEAYSRGARPVVLVERDRAALGTLRRNLALLGLEDAPGLRVVAADVARFLKGAPDPSPLGVAFLDPPYGEPRLGRWLSSLIEGEWLDSESLVVVEHRSGEPPRVPAALEALWERRYGDASLWAGRLAAR